MWRYQSNLKMAMTKLLLLFPFLFFNVITLNLLPEGKPLPTGPAIDWRPDRLLRWSDFQSKHKTASGFAVATSACGFGYDGIIQGNDIRINVYVRFYCNESWYHKDYRIGEVLKHEQLHFDICELYGRLFYKKVLSLRKRGKLDERTLKKTLDQLRDEYDATQDRYDAETNNSTNRAKQREWEQRIRNALNDNAAYANYREY